MWALLSDSGHVASFDHLGEAYTPLRQLVEQLAGREYADRVFAYKWMSSFNLTTASTSQEIAERDWVGIEYVPDQGVFRVGYGEGTRSGRSPGLAAPIRVCTTQEVGEVIDRDVRRLLLPPPPRKPESADARAVLVLVMIVSFFLMMVCSMFESVATEFTALALASGGLMLMSTALLLIGEAWNPHWMEGRWGLSSGEMVGPPNWLISLGFGIIFSSGGLLFLIGGIVGTHALAEPGLAAGVAFVLGIVLALVGKRYAQRHAESFGALHVALMQYADRHDGWFPKGETSPEASLGLLHRENPGLVTAGVLCGRTISEAAVKLWLEAGQPLTPQTCGWHYAEGLRKFDDPRLALFWDKTTGLSRLDALLSSGGHFVYFLGGSVEYIPDNRWEEFLAEQEWLRAG